MFQPNPYGNDRPLASVTGLKIVAQLSGRSTALARSPLSHAIRSRMLKYNEPSAVVFSCGATHS